MATIRIGLASQSRTVEAAALKLVAAALDIQVKRDLGPIWNVQAEVTVVEDPLRVPRGVWPIIVMDHTPSNVGGLHTTSNGVPFAVVLSARDWGLCASHECIEMLVDPTGNQTRSAPGLEVVNGELRDIPLRFDYLLEVCDPMEDMDHAYDIGGVTVADFYTPQYFDEAPAANTRYSFNGGITRPRDVRPNGYLSWHHPVLDRLQQLRVFGTPEIVTLPEHGAAGTAAGNSKREFVDKHTPTARYRPELRR